VLEDGRYDALIIDAEVRADQHVNRDEPSFAFELTIVSGAYKGVVVDVVASNIPPIVAPGATLERATFDPIEFLGIPCTLVVENGAPRLE
jgi:hypothetical protein